VVNSHLDALQILDGTLALALNSRCGPSRSGSKVLEARDGGFVHVGMAVAEAIGVEVEQILNTLRLVVKHVDALIVAVDVSVVAGVVRLLGRVVLDRLHRHEQHREGRQYDREVLAVVGRQRQNLESSQHIPHQRLRHFSQDWTHLAADEARSRDHGLGVSDLREDLRHNFVCLAVAPIVQLDVTTNVD